MTSFLFPATTASQGLRMRRTYGTLYTDIVRASSDAIDALSLYRRLIFVEGPGAENVGFAAFDAHVGDTSCQLRACMLLDLTRQHREWAAASSGHVTWLDSYIEKLRKVHENGREVLAKLTFNRTHPEKLGIGAEEDTPIGILNNLGWSEPEVPGCPEGLYPNLLEGSSTGFGFQHSYKRTKGLSLGAIGEFSVAVVQVGQPAEKKPRAKGYVSPLLDNNSTDAAAAWDPVDTRILVRFLVYSFVLSKYKTFRQFKHTVGGRLHPETAISEGDFMVHDVWEKSVRDYKYSNAPRRINQEFRALQTWISELSCAWLCHIAKESTASPGIGR